MKIGNTINLYSKTAAASVLTTVVVILLVFDGIIPHLPFYDLRVQNSVPIHLYFIFQVLICAICQILYLWIIKSSLVSNLSIGTLRKDTVITFFSVLIVQCSVIAFLLLIVFQTEIMKEYDSLGVTVTTLLSIFLSMCLTGILAFRFFLWLKYGYDRIVLAYAITMVMITVSSLILSALILSEMRYNRSTIDSSRIAISTQNITNYTFKEFQSYLSAASFVSLWLASVLLLNQTRNKWRTLKFWLIVTIPLLYYFGVFQLSLSIIFTHFDMLNAIQNNVFNLLNSILSRSIGGVLFGVAFWRISSTVKDEKIRDYLRLSSFGIMLLAVSNVDTGIFMLPYPPFGLVTLSFLGISSYLLLVGIYSSAISISLDHKVRSSIHNSVENELRFVSKIGGSQMQQQIENKVKRTTKKLSSELEKDSGIKVSLEGKELEEYISFVLKEREQIANEKNRAE